jgi:hypothetical protein
VDIRNLKQELRQPWRPDQDGFEFSNDELTLWMRRRQLTEQAKDFRIHGWLPIRGPKWRL